MISEWFSTLGYARAGADGDGIPDRWEGTGYVYGFTDANHDGFPDGLTFPAAGDGNFDIEVTVTTTRCGQCFGHNPCHRQLLGHCVGDAKARRLHYFWGSLPSQVARAFVSALRRRS